LLAFIAGCNPNTQGYKEVPKGTKVTETAHHHHEHGPHNGHLIELGEEEYHGEIVYEGAAKRISVYILGSDPHKANPIAQKEVTLNLMLGGKPVQFQAAAAPQSGDPEGQASKFELPITEEIAAHIHGLEEIKGRLAVTIGEKQYSGDLAHDHDDHDDHGAEHKDHK